MTVKQCKLDALIKRMWQQVEVKGYAELNPDDVSSLAALKAELDEARGQVVNLANESSSLKQYIFDECFVTPPNSSINADADTAAEDFMPETPITDFIISGIKLENENAFFDHAQGAGSKAERRIENLRKGASND